MHDPLEGQQVGRYVIQQKLGGGGVANVYKATDQVSGQSVALKLLPPNPDSATLDRFKREALLAGALRHPNIVRILQVGTAGDGSSAYITMELVEGESLNALLARAGKLRPDESCLLLEPIARALAYAHQNGVVHRDVKPSNILLRPISQSTISQSNDEFSSINGVFLEATGQSVVPMLSDFGIARFLDAPELTSEGRTVGTPAFMAPEQCMGSRDIDGRADIYSLGTVLYRCVVGHLPFNGTTTQILHAHVFEPVVIDEAMVRLLPQSLVEILRRTLAKAPEERYQDAGQLADALAIVGADEVSSVRSQPPDATATATIALPEVPAVKPPTSNAVQVLVSAPSYAATTTTPPIVADTKASSSKSQRPREPFWSKAMWVIFFILIIGVGGWWNVRSWLNAQQEDRQVAMPRVIVQTRTPTAMESEVVGGQGVIITTTPTAVVAIQPSPTLLPSATPSPLPSETPTLVPTQSPTDVPTVGAVVEVPTAITVVTEVVTPTLGANDVITPSEELAGACSAVLDEFFLLTLGGLSGEEQADFGCPREAAEVTMGSWLSFERGAMVAIDGQPFVYLYYADGSWEQVVSGAETPSPEVTMPPFASPFAEIWASEGRNLRLGNALSADPQQGEVVSQPFVGGMMLGNRNSGEVLLLARSKLDF